MSLSRRDLLPLLTASVAAGVLPRISRAQAKEDPYALKPFGNARIIHQTDTHAQASPCYFREPNANIGVGPAAGRPPHLVGKAFLERFQIAPDSRKAYAFTYLNFAESAERFGRLGGFAHLRSLIARLRAEVPENASLMLDGGDLMQGSMLANATDGAAMVELANMLGIDAMTGHWEFTYGQEQLRKNIAAFRGDFIAQNVFLTDNAAFNNAPAFDAASGRVFPPYVMKNLGGKRVAVIGQAFPYVPIAHPARFTPDWNFGICDQEMQQVIDTVRSKEKADAVILLSHNGMDVDLKLASKVNGIDIILGGHTHDCVPVPSIVSNAAGKTLVTNAGSAGKCVAVLDLDIGAGRVNQIRYTLLPVFSDLLPADKEVAARLASLQAPLATKADEVLAHNEVLLYRRGNFTGSMDQLICDALTERMDAPIALSPGFRWGNSFLPGQAITMGDVQTHTAITYPDVYVVEMTGAALKATMEDVCDNLFNADPYLQQGGDMVRVGGMNYACTPANPLGARISEMALSDGTPVEPAKTYKVAGWASVTQPQTTQPVWAVVADYLRDKKIATLRAPNRVRVKGVDGNPGYDAPV